MAENTFCSQTVHLYLNSVSTKGLQLVAEDWNYSRPSIRSAQTTAQGEHEAKSWGLDGNHEPEIKIN